MFDTKQLPTQDTIDATQELGLSGLETLNSDVRVQVTKRIVNRNILMILD